MWTSLKEYLPRVARAWLYALVVGGVGGGVGLVLDVLPGFDMPLWAWALVVVLALGTAQFRAFHEVRLERDTFIPEKTRPDMEAHNVCRYIKDEAAWGKGKDELDTLRELRQAALNVDVWIWGLHYTGGIDFDADKPLVRIEPDYWRDHGFEEVAIFAPPEEVKGTNMTRDEVLGRPELLYNDLQMNERQVCRRWPK